MTTELVHSDSEIESEAETSWIIWFCSLKGNEFFTEVEEDYIADDFNLTGLSSIVPHYDHALDMILDAEGEILNEEQQEMVETSAELLYGLIHARYILTGRGLANMVEKYNGVDFGRCPRVHCQGQPLLPVGQSDLPRMNTVKLFCGKCQDIYYPKLNRHANIDGAYFGTTFPHLLLQMYPELVPFKPASLYVPRIYGFKIHKTSRSLPQPHPSSAEAKQAKQAQLAQQQQKADAQRQQQTSSSQQPQSSTSGAITNTSNTANTTSAQQNNAATAATSPAAAAATAAAAGGGAAAAATGKKDADAAKAKA